MDQIEFRPMNTAIQATGSAAIVDPAASMSRRRKGCGCGQTTAAAAANGNTNGCNNSCNNGCTGQTTDTTENGHIYYGSCEEAKIKQLEDIEILTTGRVMDVALTLRNVCPCRHVSVGYLVTELDEENNEYARGFKAFTVEPHYNSRCCDMELETTRFILPDDARVDNGTGQCCGTRHFIVRAEAHYADTNVSAT